MVCHSFGGYIYVCTVANRSIFLQHLFLFSALAHLLHLSLPPGEATLFLPAVPHVRRYHGLTISHFLGTGLSEFSGFSKVQELTATYSHWCVPSLRDTQGASIVPSTGGPFAFCVRCYWLCLLILGIRRPER